MIFVFLSPYEICLQSDRFCFHGYWFLSSRSNPWLLRVYIPSFQFILQVFLYPSIILSYTYLLYKLLLFKFIILQVFIHQVVSHFFFAPYKPTGTLQHKMLRELMSCVIYFCFAKQIYIFF